MISCVTKQDSPDKISVLLLSVCCLLLACTMNCEPIIQGPRQQYQEEHTTSEEAKPIMSPIDQGRILPGRPEYLVSTQMLGPPNFREFEQTNRRRTWEDMRDDERQGDQYIKGHFLTGEFNVIKYDSDPEVTSETTDFSLLESRGDTSNLDTHEEEVDKALEHEELIRLRSERRGRFKYSGHGMVLEDTTDLRHHKPVKLQSIPIDEFTQRLQYASTFHDILRIFYGQYYTNNELEHMYLTDTNQLPNTAITFQSPMAAGSVYNNKRVALSKDIRPESTSALEQGTNLMQDRPNCEKCSHISGSGRFKSSLIKGEPFAKHNHKYNKQRRHTNKSKPRRRRHNKHKHRKKTKKESEPMIDLVTTEQPEKPKSLQEQIFLTGEKARQHHQRINDLDTSCRPTPVIVPLKDIARSADKIYFPHCTQLYRCQESSACCIDPGESCMPKTVVKVVLHFLTMFWQNNTLSVTEVFVFENHTECECRNVSNTITQCKKCPWPFIQYRDPDDMSCHCGCVEGRNLKMCRNISRGSGYLKEKEHKCVESGICGIPDCPRGEFNIPKGRCLKKKEYLKSKELLEQKSKSSREHSRRKLENQSHERSKHHHKAKSQKAVKHDKDGRNHHDNNKDVSHHGHKGDNRHHSNKDDVRIQHGNKGETVRDEVIPKSNEGNVNSRVVNETNGDNVKGQLSVEGGIVINEHKLTKSQNSTAVDVADNQNVSSSKASNISLESGDGDYMIVSGSEAQNESREHARKNMGSVSGGDVIGRTNSSQSLVKNNTNNLQNVSKIENNVEMYGIGRNETIDVKGLEGEQMSPPNRYNISNTIDLESNKTQRIIEQNNHTYSANKSEDDSPYENIDVKLDKNNKSHVEEINANKTKVKINNSVSLKDLLVGNHSVDEHLQVGNNSNISENDNIGSADKRDGNIAENVNNDGNIKQLNNNQVNQTENNPAIINKHVKTEQIIQGTNKTSEDLGSSGYDVVENPDVK